MSSLAVSNRDTLQRTVNTLVRVLSPQLTLKFLNLYLTFYQHVKELEKEGKESYQELQGRIYALAASFGSDSSLAFKNHEIQRRVRWIKSELSLLHHQQQGLERRSAVERLELQRAAKTVHGLSLQVQENGAFLSKMTLQLQDVEGHQAQFLSTLAQHSAEMRLCSSSMSSFGQGCTKFSEDLETHSKQMVQLDRRVTTETLRQDHLTLALRGHHDGMNQLEQTITHLKKRVAKVFEHAELESSFEDLEKNLSHLNQQLAQNHVWYVILMRDVNVALESPNKLRRCVVVEESDTTTPAPVPVAAPAPSRESEIVAYVADQMRLFHEESRKLREEREAKEKEELQRFIADSQARVAVSALHSEERRKSGTGTTHPRTADYDSTVKAISDLHERDRVTTLTHSRESAVLDRMAFPPRVSTYTRCASYKKKPQGNHLVEMTIKTIGVAGSLFSAFYIVGKVACDSGYIQEMCKNVNLLS